MLLSARNARRVVAGVAGTGAVAGAMLFGAIPSALADDPANNPPTAARPIWPAWLRVSRHRPPAYLFTHPDVNNFFTSLEGLPREEVRNQGARLPGSEPADEGGADRYPPAAGRPEEPLRRSSGSFHPVTECGWKQPPPAAKDT